MRGLFVATAMAASVFYAASTVAMAFGDHCYAPLAADGGKEHSKHDAMWSAIDAWEHQAGHKHGGSFDNWHYSGDRQISCDWDSKGRHFWCTARAMPCGRPHHH